MGYQALYRKYRPKNLNEIYGQPVAVNILKNAVENKKFGHAYLFTGSRGCGKTSTAKIFARMVNCENIKDGVPCGECLACKNSFDNNCVDILEIDAASNNGVDEIRELKSKVNLIPSVLKYKVYIIDEVHMLSNAAFNALLKTLEEPPEHIIFILATTELYKVPSTIVSRCQTIEFKKINNKDMFARLKEISNLEKIDITDDAIQEIVNVSDGGLRDAISLLDMATSYTNNKITDEDIFAINGIISNNEIDFLADLIVEKKRDTVLQLINEYYDSGKDLVKICEKIICNLREKMLKSKNKNICSIVETLLETADHMHDASLGKIYFEISIYKICEGQEVLKQEININNKSEEISESNKATNIILNNEHETLQQESENKVVSWKNDDNFKNIRINNTFVEVNKQILVDIKNNWKKLNDYTFDKEFGALVCELLDAIPLAASPKYLILGYSYDSFVEKGNMYIDKYERTLSKILNYELKLIFVTSNEWLKIKKEYVENIKNNVQYKYIEELVKKDDEADSSSQIVHSNLLKRANELFDMSKIEIKENL